MSNARYKKSLVQEADEVISVLSNVSINNAQSLMAEGSDLRQVVLNMKNNLIEHEKSNLLARLEDAEKQAEVTLRLSVFEFEWGIFGNAWSPDTGYFNHLVRVRNFLLLILAAIFHDIGKGRGGDHSVIGEGEAYDFCIEHGLSKPEAKLVSWLVRHHLLMSVTAQRRDIYDPDVITEFAKQVRDEEYLEYLVCLTVADICATNPELWNSWKRTLLAELFYSTQRALRRGLENPVDVRERIRHNQQMASAQLRKEGFSAREIEVLWQRFKADYFLRHTHKQIAWHCENLLRMEDTSKPLVLISKKATRGGTEVFVYSPDQPALFATVVAELDRRNFNVHDAQIMTSKDGYVLDTFMVLDQHGKAIEEGRHSAVTKHITHVLEDGRPTKIKTRRTPNKLQHFNVKTKVDFLPTKSKKRTLMEFVALDTPGLLAKVGRTFADLGINLHAAKITTIGERAEDLFILTSEAGGRLSEEQQTELREKLIEKLSDSVSA